MRTAASLVLICVGAVLALATDASVSGVDLTVVGVSLVGLGSVGLVMALLVWDRLPQAPLQHPYAGSTVAPVE